MERIRQNNWDEVAFLVLMILAAVTAIDMALRALRQRIIQGRQPLPAWSASEPWARIGCGPA